jgi:hypothetical protein
MCRRSAGGQRQRQASRKSWPSSAMGESDGGDETDVHRVSPCRFRGWELGSFTMDTLQTPETLRNPQVGVEGSESGVGAVQGADDPLARLLDGSAGSKGGRSITRVGNPGRVPALATLPQNRHEQPA